MGPRLAAKRGQPIVSGEDCAEDKRNGGSEREEVGSAAKLHGRLSPRGAVIPAEAGIQGAAASLSIRRISSLHDPLDARVRGHDMGVTSP